MRFKGKCSIWKQVTHTSAAPKAVDTEFRVFRPNLSTNPDGPPVLECRTKQSTYKYKFVPGCCELLGQPNVETKMTLNFKQSKTFILISSISPSDHQSLRFIVEHFVLGKHKEETEKASRLVHNPYGAPITDSLKSEPKTMILAGPDAMANFQRKAKLSSALMALTIKNSQIRLDGRIFVLEQLQELFLENIGLNVARNTSILTNLCRLNNLKTLSLANNAIEEIPDDVWTSIPSRLQQLVLSGNRLSTLPRQMMHLQRLIILDVSNNRLEEVHEDICQLKALQYVKLQQNSFKTLPYTMLYGRRYRELNLTENSRLFNENSIAVERHQLNQLDDQVPNLKFLSMARIFNCSERAASLLPEHLRQNREFALHRCFMCLKCVPQHGRYNVTFGRADIREHSLDVHYSRLEVSINYCAFVCLKCKPKAQRFKLFS